MWTERQSRTVARVVLHMLIFEAENKFHKKEFQKEVETAKY